MTITETQTRLGSSSPSSVSERAGTRPRRRLPCQEADKSASPVKAEVPEQRAENALVVLDHTGLGEPWDLAEHAEPTESDEVAGLRRAVRCRALDDQHVDVDRGAVVDAADDRAHCPRELIGDVEHLADQVRRSFAEERDPEVVGDVSVEVCSLGDARR